MPLYEYKCQSCGRRSTFFLRSMGAPVDAVCGHCSSREMVRVISSFAHHRSAKDVHESSPMPPPGAGFDANMDYYKDPRNIGRWVEQSFEKQGMDLPKEAREAIDSAREGVIPKELDL